ncbi:MAG: hypothetical protein ACYDD1_21860, partial [Caulobacteraceae bacterium]
SGRAAHLEHSVRYARAEEFVAVAKKLWDSWEDGAYLGDKASGRNTDPDRIHGVFHKGEHFSVAGPLNTPRGPRAIPCWCRPARPTPASASPPAPPR